MQTVSQIREMLAERGLRPKRSLGQNFLIDQNLIRKLVEAAGVGEGDLVLEVGPGTGTLTEALLARGCRVVACELDDALAELLIDRAASLPGGRNLIVVRGDCLSGKRSLSGDVAGALGDEPFSLVANLPYGAATPLITTLLINHPACGTLAVTVQREVADRLAARPGTKSYGALSVLAQSVATIRRLASVPPSCFWPRPEVTSSMLLISRLAEPLTDDAAGLMGFATKLYTSRRKVVASVLGREFPYPEGIDPNDRPERLAPDRLIALFGAWRSRSA